MSAHNSDTSIHELARDGHVDAIRASIAMGADVSSRDDRNYTPLHFAAQYGQMEVTHLLVDAGADVSSRTDRQSTALHFSAQDGHSEVTRFLISAGADVLSRNIDSCAPLHYAALNGHVDTVLTLIDAGADVSSHDSFQRTPLHCASENGQRDVAHALLGAGADVSSRDGQQWTPLHCAVHSGYGRDTIRVLLSAGADVSSRDNREWTPLHFAAQKGHAEGIRVLLDAGADVSSRDDMRWTPLHLSAQDGNVECVQLLLSAGADVSCREEYNFTPLHISAQNGHRGTNEALLDAGADINCRSQEQWTPLHCAADNGHSDTIQPLLDAGADVSNRDVSEWTPLHYAADNGHSDTIRVLLHAGADVASREESMWTPLHLAAQNGHVSACNALLTMNANVLARTIYGADTIDTATINGNCEVVKLLLPNTQRAAPCDSFAKMTSSVEWAILRNEVDILKVLVEHAPQECFVRNADGWIPLQLAVFYNSAKGVEILVETMSEFPPRLSMERWSSTAIAKAMGRPLNMITEVENVDGPNCSETTLHEWVESVRCSQLLQKTLDRRIKENPLGAGGFGEVVGVDVPSGETFALKRSKHNNRMALIFEASVLKLIKHPFIVEVEGIYEDVNSVHRPPQQPTTLSIVMERMNGSNLLDWMNEFYNLGRQNELDEALFRPLMKQALEALGFLHQPVHIDPFGRRRMTVVHHDIKPHNMLIHVAEEDTVTLKLADFGLSRFDRYPTKSHLASIGGTRGYLGPETKRNARTGQRQYTPASDIYSWGKSFLEVSAHSTFNFEPTPEAVQKLLATTSLTSQAQHIILKCLDPDPESRPTASELLQDDYFTADELFHNWYYSAIAASCIAPATTGGNHDSAGSVHHLGDLVTHVTQQDRTAPTREQSSVVFPATQQSITVPSSRQQAEVAPPSSVSFASGMSFHRDL